MRKKLLALLMCATMVLGTAATAFAAVPSEDTYAIAKKVFNGTKFYNELNENEAALSTTVRADKIDGMPSQKWKVTTGLESWKLYNDEFAVKINPGTDDANVKDTLYVADYSSSSLYPVPATADDGTTTDYKVYGVELLADDGTKVADATTPNPSVGTAAYSGITAVNVNVGGKNYVGYAQYVKLSNNDTILGNYDSGSFAASKIYVVNKAGYTIGTVTPTTTLDSTTAKFTTIPEVAGTVTYNTSASLVFSQGDGLYKLVNNNTGDTSYAYVVNAKAWNQDIKYADVDGYLEANYDDNGTFKKTSSLVASNAGYKAAPSAFNVDAKSVTRDGSSNVYYIKFSSVGSGYTDEQLNTVAYALDDGTLSENAVAIRYTIYKGTYDQKVASSSSKVLQLAPVESVSSNVTFTLSDDVLSRTKLKGSDNVRVYAFDKDDKYTKDNLTLYNLANLGESAVAGTFTFSTRDFSENVLIFDGFEDESQNDGVADETTTTTTAAAASTTAATSPKTGDVAPIAALAVVMMGACGAMVVASKKRA